MPDSLPWYILDTNIPIDLQRGGLLDALFALGLALAAPDVLIGELVIPDGPSLVERGLRSMPLTGPEVEDVMTLATQHRAPSINDLFAFVLARKLDATLLTGDRALRRLAASEGVPVHGTLWLLDKMVSRTVITPTEAADALARMLAGGSRLPAGECRARLRRWRAR